MKHTVIVFTFLILVSCNNKKETRNEKPIKNIDWITGNWILENDKPQETTKEHWVKKDALNYTGTAYTLKENDTIFKEDLYITYVNNQWELTVKGVHDDPVTFKMTVQNKYYFKVENPENEFPQQIEYTLKKGKLQAVIATGDESISFIYNAL